MSGDPAKARYIVIHLARWSGLVMVLVGLLAMSRKLALPEVASYVLLIAGLIDALMLPTLLARRWKSPPQ